MPATEPLPTIPELLDAFNGAIASGRKGTDDIGGAHYDLWAGVGALLWRRMAERDQDEFRSIYFRTARARALDAYIAQRFPNQLPRAENTPGSGYAYVSRPNATAGGGSFLDGTRIQVGGNGGTPLRTYLVDGTVPLSSPARLDFRVPIVSADFGPAAAIQLNRGEAAVLKIVDPLWDNTWSVDRIECGAGTLREEDDPLRARIVRDRLDSRPGFELSITTGMRAAGAERVVLFRSDADGEAYDFGLNRLYVGDANYATSASLLQACRLALPAYAVAGTSVQVLPMAAVELSLDVTVHFWQEPARIAQASASTAARAAVLGYFATRENPFLWSVTGIQGAIQGAVRNVQMVEINASPPEPVPSDVHTSAPLMHHRVTEASLRVSLDGPT